MSHQIYEHDEYPTNLNVRASNTLKELSNILVSRINDDSSRQSTLVKSTGSWGVAASHKQSDASFKLRDLLSKPSPILNARQSVELVHSNQDAIDIQKVFHSYALYTQQLEAENLYIKDEMQTFKLELQEVLTENEKLHKELRTSVIQEIIHETSMNEPLTRSSENIELFGNFAPKVVNRSLKNDLNQLKEMHEAKAARLESQLKSVRHDLAQSQMMTEELKSQLRMKDSLPPHISTYDDPSAANSFSEPNCHFHQQTIARQTKEKEELLVHLASLKRTISEMERREEEAHMQIKSAIELAERAHLEQSEAEITKQQLQHQLDECQNRFTDHVNSVSSKVDDARRVAVKENEIVVENLNQQIKNASENNFRLQEKLNKCNQERKSAITELDNLRVDFKNIRREATEASIGHRSESMNSTLIREQSLAEVCRMRDDFLCQQKEIDRERSRLQSEMSELSRRLSEAERNCVTAKEESLHSQSRIQSLEHDLQVAKISRDNVEKLRKKDLAYLIKQGEEKEAVLNSTINELESKYESLAKEMDTILQRQKLLITKYKTECDGQVSQMELLSGKYQSEVQLISDENQNLQMRLRHSLNKTEQLEDVNAKHICVHDKLQERLRSVDELNQTQSKQILDLLDKQGEMMKQRQMLAQEVRYLRSRLVNHSAQETSHHKPIDNILSTVVSDNVDHIIQSYSG